MKKPLLLSLMLAILFTACKDKVDINKSDNESGDKLKQEFKHANIDGKDYGSFRDEHSYHVTEDRVQQAQQAKETLSLKQVFTVVYATSDDGFVNIREQPSSKAKVLGELHAPFDGLGEGVLIEKGTDWCKVSVKNVIGYVYTKYVGFETWYEGSGDSMLVANLPQTSIYENAEVEDGPVKFSVVEKGTILGNRFEDFGEYYALPTDGNYLLVRKRDSKIVVK